MDQVCDLSGPEGGEVLSCRPRLCLHTAGPEFFCPWCSSSRPGGESGRQGTMVQIPGVEDKGLRMVCLKLTLTLTSWRSLQAVSLLAKVEMYVVIAMMCENSLGR